MRATPTRSSLALESASERSLGPEEVLADTLYGSDYNCNKIEAMGVAVVSPAMGSVKEETISFSDFCFSDRGKIIACPQGHFPGKTKHKKNTYTAAFEFSHCATCPMSQQCPVNPGKKHYHLRYEDRTMRIVRRRTIEHSAEFKDKYRWRAGVEATMSEYDRTTGVKRLRVRGFPAVRFCATLKAIGANIMRATAFRKDQGTGSESAEKGCLLLDSVISVVKERAALAWGLVKHIFSPLTCPNKGTQTNFAS